MKSLIITTALSAAMLGTAFAQTTAPAPMKDQSQPNMPQSSTMPSSTAPMASTPSFIGQQANNQWLASNFKGTDVIGPQEEKIGDVSDVLFDREGKVVAYVVGVGGFLGIGTKDVALAPSSFTFVPGQSDNDYKLRLSMTKDQLKNAVAFEPKTVRSTTGAGTPAPGPMGTRPATAPNPANPPK